MAKKRKKTFEQSAVDMINTLHTLAIESGADYDAMERAAKEVATAAGFRRRVKRRKTLEQMIDLNEAQQAAAETRVAQKAARLKKRNAAASKKRAATKKAKAA